MKKLIMVIALFTMILVLSACKPLGQGEVDCTLNPNHEDCAEVDPCDENPEDPLCNIVYTYEDSYALLDFDNEEIDDFDTVFTNMNTVVTTASYLFDVRKDYLFYSFYSDYVNSESGLTKGQLVNFDYPDDIMLAGIDMINLSISGEVSRFSINLQDDEFVEDQAVDMIVFDDYNSSSKIFVNENSFHYSIEVERIDNPGVNVSYYEMNLILDGDRLVFEIASYSDVDTTEGFGYAYSLYDSEVGYIIKNLRYNNESLLYYENQVDLNEHTAEIKEISLGGFRTFYYINYDFNDGFYYQKHNSLSQISEAYGTSEIAYYDGNNQVLSFKEYAEMVDEAYVPTGYGLSYNIAYLNDWEIVYGDYLVKNNNEVGYVSNGSGYHFSNNFMEVNLDFDDYPIEDEFDSPGDGISFDFISYSDLTSEMDTYSSMTNPVLYANNIASVVGIDYDIRTDLMDLFLSDLPQIVSTKIMESIITDEILFGGEEDLMQLIDCQVTPEHDLCIDPQ